MVGRNLILENLHHKYDEYNRYVFYLPDEYQFIGKELLHNIRLCLLNLKNVSDDKIKESIFYHHYQKNMRELSKFILNPITH